MTERELRAVAEAILEESDGYMSNERIAQAAISASDSKYVKGLVEALKECMVCLPQDHNDEVIAWNKANAELQNLPEDLR